MGKGKPSSPNPFSHQGRRGARMLQSPSPALGEGFRVRVFIPPPALGEGFRVRVFGNVAAPRN